MQIIIVRHGTALPESLDEKRPLSIEGKNEAQATAKILKDNNFNVQKIFHSSKVRAMQTAEIIKNILNPQAECSMKEGLLPNDNVDELIFEIPSWKTSTMIVGHLPFVSNFLSGCINADEGNPQLHFHPGSAAVIERVSEKNWEMVMFIKPENSPA